MGGTGGGWSWLLLWWSEFSKSLIHLSADGWDWVPSLLVVWPEATQHWSLPGLFGGANGGLWEGSLQGVLPRILLPVSLSSQWDTATPCLCRRPTNTSRWIWFSLLWGHGSFPWVPMYTLLCVCPPRVESLFPPVLSKSCNQISQAFKVWFSRNSFSHCRTPRLGSLTWGSEPSLKWVDFCGISVLQFVSHPPSSYGIWFHCDCTPPTISLWLLLCLWMWGIFFGEFQCLPVDDCPAASCDSVALTRGSKSTSLYSTILSQSLFFLIVKSCLVFLDMKYLRYTLLWDMLFCQYFARCMAEWLNILQIILHSKLL